MGQLGRQRSPALPRLLLLAAATAASWQVSKAASSARRDYRLLGANHRWSVHSLLTKSKNFKLASGFKTKSTAPLSASKAVAIFNSTLGADLQNLAQAVYGDRGEVKTEAVKCEKKDSSGTTVTKVRFLIARFFKRIIARMLVSSQAWLEHRDEERPTV